MRFWTCQQHFPSAFSYVKGLQAVRYLTAFPHGDSQSSSNLTDV